MFTPLQFVKTLTAAMAMVSIAATADADIIYNVVPVTLSNGYEVTGGTITTDGSVGGDFVKASIIDYEIVIGGTLDFTFTPTNAGARVFNAEPELVVTANEIFFPALPVGETADFRFESRVQFDTFASLSVQQLFWSQGSNPTQRSQTGLIVQSFGGGAIQPSNGSGTNTVVPMLDKFVIAAVPEPSSLALLSLAGVFALRGRRSEQRLKR